MSDTAAWANPGLTQGTRIEVRTTFDGRWARGFEVEAGDAGGYQVRRLSDGTVLPVVFPPDAVRRESRTGLW